jgi:hypothetical protein
MWFAKEVCILTGGNKLKVDSEQAGTERAFNTCLRAKILELQHWTLVIHCWQAFRVGAALTLPLCLRRSVGIPAQLASLRLAVGGACSFVFLPVDCPELVTQVHDPSRVSLGTKTVSRISFHIVQETFALAIMNMGWDVGS